MNKVALIGRTTADIELKATGSGKNVCSFTVAVNRRGRDEGTDFINCVAWEKTAEFLSKYIHKGERVALTGRLTNRSYENREGKKVTVTEVTVEEAEFVEAKSKKDPDEGFAPVLNDDDIPF